MPSHISDTLVSWATDIDDGTIRQAGRTARLPIVAGHVAIAIQMPNSGTKKRTHLSQPTPASARVAMK